MLTIQFPLNEFQQSTLRARNRLDTARQEILEILGIQLLSLAQQAYVQKAGGGTGDDGITWAPLKESTVKAKSRRGRPQATKARTGPKSRKGSRVRPTRTGFTDPTEIGVDSGLQRASAGPGFSAPDGLGGNVFQLAGDEITVGYGRDYSDFFDEKRTLIPDELPDKWQEPMDEQIEDWAESIIEEELNA